MRYKTKCYIIETENATSNDRGRFTLIWVIIIASVGGLLLLAIARAPHEDPPPSGNASRRKRRGAAEKYDRELEESIFRVR